MFFSIANKKSFLDLLQTRNSSQIFHIGEITELPSIEGEELLFVWKKDYSHNQYLPIYICTPSGKSREFIAWVSTYLKQMKPFTAFTRVIDIDQFILLQNTKSMDLSIQVTNALVGLVVGETLEFQKRGMVKHQNPMAAKSTFSHAIAMSVVHNLPYDISEISKRYEKARRFALSPSSLSNSIIMGIWKNVLHIIDIGLKSSDSYQDKLFFYPISNILSCIARGYEIKHSMVVDVLRQSNDTPDIPKSSDIMEKRVESFEKVCTFILSNRQIHPQSASFTIACLANLISPGTMRHHSLLDHYFREFPGVYAWYGVCAGLTPNSDVLSYNYGLGWRVLRQLLRKTDLFEYPDSDICFNEYEMLLSSENPDTSFNTESANNLSIELVPGITTFIPWPPKTGQKENMVTNDFQEQQKLFDSKAGLLSLEDLGDKIYEAIDIYKKLSEVNLKSKNNDKKQKSKTKKNINNPVNPN